MNNINLNETRPDFFDPENLSDDWKFADDLYGVIDDGNSDREIVDIPTDYIDEIVSKASIQELKEYLERISDDSEFYDAVIEYINSKYPGIFPNVQWSREEIEN